MKKSHKSPLAIALGASLLSGLAATSAQADPTAANHFEFTPLSNGYMQMAEADPHQGMDGKTMEGKCGNKKDGAMKAQEGGDKSSGEIKAQEGNCGGKKMDETVNSETKPVQ